MLSSHPPKETSAIPEWRGSARLLTEGGETHFPDENRSWELSGLCGNWWCRGLDQTMEILRLIFFLTGAQTTSKFPLEQGLCCEDH